MCSSGYISVVAKVRLRGLLSCDQPTEIGTAHKSVCVSRRSITPQFIYCICLDIPLLAISYGLVGWYLKDVHFIALCFMCVLILSFISFLSSFLSFSVRFQAEADIFPLLTASRRPPPTSLTTLYSGDRSPELQRWSMKRNIHLTPVSKLRMHGVTSLLLHSPT